MSISHGEASTSRVEWVLEDKHKIFLSHSGAQKAFVMQLNEDFKACDRYPFFDMEYYSLPIGEPFPHHIFEAIRQCEVGLVVLSEEFFTRSHWPMTELVEMVKLKKKIVPLFLGVLPEDLKKKDHLACWISQWEAWKKLNDRVDVGEWKEALRQLKVVNGLVFKHGEGVVKFREKIVKVINQIVRAWSRWDDSHVQGRSRLCKVVRDKVEAMPTSSSGRPQIVGLYGVGGIGKTTTCKSLCNEYMIEFEGRVCHIEFSLATSLKDRMQEVLRRFTNSNDKVLKRMSEEECVSRLRNAQFEKVFLAIDNVSCNSRILEEASRYLNVKYGYGSILLVTARSKDELKELNINVDHCLTMPELEKDEAIALFCHHATPIIDDGESLDEEVVNCCAQRCYFGKGDGSGSSHYHPLALKVLGNQLRSRDPKEWALLIKEDVVFNLRREQEHPIFSILRSSFDALREEDQVLFMDVALFDNDDFWTLFAFGRRDYDSCVQPFLQWLAWVHDVFNANGNGRKRLDTLKTKSLLEEVGNGQSSMGMHDLWREFAVIESGYGEFRKGRWVYEVVEGEAMDSILSDGGWKDLERICVMGGLNNWPRYPSAKCLNFCNCTNVTVLRLVDVDVEDGVLDLSPLIQLKILEILQRRFDPLEVIGIGNLRNLRVLVWSNIMVLSLDTLGQVLQLKYLRVLDLESWDDVSASLNLSELRWLEYLRVGFWGEVIISGLSSKMTHLRIVDLSRSLKLQSCLGVGDVDNLEVLALRGCGELKVLPDLQKLSKLRLLDITGCWRLKTVMGLGSLVALEHLCARGCGELFTQECEKLQVEHCLEPLSAQLEKLDGVLDLSRLTNLQMLDLRDCKHVKHILGLSNLIALQYIWGCSQVLDNFPDHIKLSKLKSVLIEDGDGTPAVLQSGDNDNEHGLEELQPPLNLAVLESVSLLSMGGVHREVRHISKLTNLKDLTLNKCRIKALPGLSSLTALTRLVLENCGLETLPDLGQLIELESLEIEGCELLTSLTISGPLRALRILSLSFCESLVVLPDVGLLSGLQNFELKHCGVKLNAVEVEILRARCYCLYVDKPSLEFNSETINEWRDSNFEVESKCDSEEIAPIASVRSLESPSSVECNPCLEGEFVPYNELNSELGFLWLLG